MATKDDIHAIGSITAPPRPQRTTTDNDVNQPAIAVPDPDEPTPPHLVPMIAQLFVATGSRLTDIAMLSVSDFDLESHHVPTEDRWSALRHGRSEMVFISHDAGRDSVIMEGARPRQATAKPDFPGGSRENV